MFKEKFDKFNPGPRWLCAIVHIWVAMYYILEWMLVGLIPHVDAAFVAANIRNGCILLKIIAFVNF